ncbi:MAG: hypothetical protein WKF43_01545 [Acidimicrobiales bacterium]
MTTSAARPAEPSPDRPDERGSVEDAAARGLEALQAAAHDMIAAAKAMLEVADDLVGDPRTARDLLSVLSSVVAPPPRKAPPGRDRDVASGDQDDDDDGRVQRIPVS